MQIIRTRKSFLRKFIYYLVCTLMCIIFTPAVIFYAVCMAPYAVYESIKEYIDSKKIY